MKEFLVVAGTVILIILFLMFLRAFIVHQKLTNNGFLSLDILTQDELDWLSTFYENWTRVKYDSGTRGLSIKRPTSFHLKALKSMKNRQLTEAQLDDVIEKLYNRINRIPLNNRDNFEEEILIKLLKIKESGE